jgi:protein-L-isoaspartate(D-aspartate) O-methyltransferase
MNMDIERTRFNMVEQQVRPWDVIDQRVLEVLGQVRREDFVPDAQRALAFADTALPIGHGESMMRPIVEGRMLQALAIDSGDGVLEIGTGSGFITACLGALARDVTSVEIHADLAAAAERKLVRAGVTNCRVHHADALVGFAPNRSFDVIAVTGAVFQEPVVLRSWLAIGGRMFLVRGESPAMEAVLITRVGASEFREQSLFETDLNYLTHAAPPKRFML